jgi:hypothetical protein
LQRQKVPRSIARRGRVSRSAPPPGFAAPACYPGPACEPSRIGARAHRQRSLRIAGS